MIGYDRAHVSKQQGKDTIPWGTNDRYGTGRMYPNNKARTPTKSESIHARTAGLLPTCFPPAVRRRGVGSLPANTSSILALLFGYMRPAISCHWYPTEWCPCHVAWIHALSYPIIGTLMTTHWWVGQVWGLVQQGEGESTCTKN